MTTKSCLIQIADLAERCKCNASDLLHEAAKGNLKLSIAFYGEEPRNLHFRAPLDCKDSPSHPDSGIFDLHLGDVRALLQAGSVALDAIFSPCGQWILVFNPCRYIHLSDVVIRIEEAQAFELGFDLTPPVTDTERSRLLRQIAAMALLVAAQSKTYKVGSKPSADSISEGVGILLDALPNANLKGLGNTNIRTAISAGLKLLGVV